MSARNGRARPPVAPRHNTDAQHPTDYTRCSIRTALSSSMAYQVQKRKQEHPDDIDKMPVQACDLDGIVISMRKFSKPGKQCQNQHHSDSDGNMDRVQPGHSKVDPEK